jgi:hypothetical protein
VDFFEGLGELDFGHILLLSVWATVWCRGHVACMSEAGTCDDPAIILRWSCDAAAMDFLILREIFYLYTPVDFPVLQGALFNRP